MLLLVTIGSLIVLLALLILFHHNLNATKGYRLRSLESVRNQLLLSQETLNMEIAKSQALNTLEHDQKVEAMIRATKPQYVHGDSSIARLIRGSTDTTQE